MKNKYCSYCDTYKPAVEFYKQKSSPDGLQYRCKDCSVLARKKWAEDNNKSIRRYRDDDYRKHADGYKERAHRWRKENHEKKKLVDKIWRTNNKEKKAAIDKKWRENNRDKEEHNRKSREYAKAHPDKSRENVRRRRAIKCKAPGRGVTASQEKDIIAQHSGICVYCGKKANKIELDHIVPLARGGAHDIDNIALSCDTCNRKKGAKSLLVFLYGTQCQR